MWDFTVASNGIIERLVGDGNEIGMQKEYAGPVLYIKKDDVEQAVSVKFHSKNNKEHVYIGEYEGLLISLIYSATESFNIRVKIENKASCDLDAQRIALRLGIDTYMEKFPQWNDVLFPTMLRCEKNSFWGYFMSPNNKILAIASPNEVRSWSLVYNKVNADNYGHRIYTADIVLFEKEKQPERHTQNFTICKAQQNYEWNFHLKMCEKEADIAKVCSELTRAPIAQIEQYTVARKERINGTVYSAKPAQLTVLDTDCKEYLKMQVTGDFSFDVKDECGLYTLIFNDGHYETQAQVYVREVFSWYMEKARENALNKPQKATTHLESWYGFFSIMLGDKHFKDEIINAQHQKLFDSCFTKLYDMQTLEPLIEPERICNTATAISLLVDAYEAYGEIKYAKWAVTLGDWMMKHQIADGSYRAYLFTFAFDEEVATDGIHYTSVIYAMKSMLELVMLEEKLSKEHVDMKEAYKRHFNSVMLAADNLVACKDNIDTEGEITFEDGMISCSALQLGKYALYIEGKGLKADKYIEVARELLEKHKCLEQHIMPDCRRNGATLRFWEAQYDVLLDKNMINSPHGWTSWKNYATYYLYLLTGETRYLKDTINTIGTCMQMIDVHSGELRWAFVCDPCLKTNVFSKGDRPGEPKRIETVIGEQYMDMISGWWRTVDDSPVGAYPLMRLRIGDTVVPNKNIGGCCDNDVHEHFKCMEEVVLTKAYVAQKEDGGLICWNCKAQIEDDICAVEADDEIVTSLHVNLIGKYTVKAHFAKQKIVEIVDKMQWLSVE